MARRWLLVFDLVGRAGCARLVCSLFTVQWDGDGVHDDGSEDGWGTGLSLSSSCWGPQRDGDGGRLDAEISCPPRVSVQWQRSDVLSGRQPAMLTPRHPHLPRRQWSHAGLHAGLHAGCRMPFVAMGLVCFALKLLALMGRRRRPPEGHSYRGASWAGIVR